MHKAKTFRRGEWRRNWTKDNGEGRRTVYSFERNHFMWQADLDVTKKVQGEDLGRGGNYRERGEKICRL